MEVVHLEFTCVKVIHLCGGYAPELFLCSKRSSAIDVKDKTAPPPPPPPPTHTHTHAPFSKKKSLLINLYCSLIRVLSRKFLFGGKL